jgi:hypothetical protein
VRVLAALSLVMAVFNQPLPIIKAMSLTELFVFAKIAAGMSGRKFE